MKHWFSDAPAFRRDPLDAVMAAGLNATTPLVRLHLGPRPRYYLIVDPDVVKPLLRSDGEAIDKGMHVAKLRPIVGSSTLTMSGPEQKRRRGALHSVLARGIVERLVKELAAEVRMAAVSAVAKGSFNAHEMGAALALRLVTVAVFGRNVLSSADESAMIAAIKRVEDDVADEMFRVFPLMPWERKRRDRERRNARATLKFIVSRVRERAAETSAMHALNKLGLSDEELCDEMITLLIAGHHTTGANITWILHHLAQDPDLANEVRMEAHAAYGADGDITADGMKNAELSIAFVREALRLYPSSCWFVREPQADMEIGGQKINKGSVLMFSPWLLHRDPRHWEDPETFRVDRDFSRNRAFLPFGAGPRACVGMGFALLELQLIALEFASALDMRSSATGVLKPKGSVTLQPPAITISVRPAPPMNRSIASVA